MKTRKVGRVLSLLLAIAMVVGLMIPASSVLAETAGTTFDESKAIVIDTAENDPQKKERDPFYQLRDALYYASEEETTYIRLGTNVNLIDVVEAMQASGESSSNVNYSRYYTGTYIKYDKADQRNGKYWSTPNQVSSYDATQTKTNSQTLYYKYYDPSSEYYQLFDFFNTSFSLIPFDASEEMRDLLGVGPHCKRGTGYDKKIGYEYEYFTLIVKAGTEVVLDLNGYAISGANAKVNANAFNGDPNIMTSVITVKGKLTMMDTNTSGNGQGMITGGSGGVLASISGDSNGTVNRIAHFYDDWSICDKNNNTDGKYRIYFKSYSTYIENATKSQGGGIYVADGGKFILESGSITNNCAWSSANSLIFKNEADMYSQGGGVYVSGGGIFEMHGGSITNNVARAYITYKSADLLVSNKGKHAIAQGGGVYLASGAKMTFTAGNIDSNASYAETFGYDKMDTYSQGAGVYVAEGATLNMMGSASAEGATTYEMRKAFPSISDNSAGSISRGGECWMFVQGGGVYLAGTMNISKAMISANDFTEYFYDNPASPPGNPVVTVVRDTVTGEAAHTDDGELITEQLEHETSGKYGTARNESTTDMYTDGAGVCVTSTGTLNIGERTWIYDNWDLVTHGHKAFGDTREYTRHWDAEKGEYVYDSASTGAGNGYCWSDTRDDVYLSGDRVMYIGEDLFECKIGVNYDRMVGAKAGGSEAAAGKLGQASNRVIVRMSDDLDSSVWGEKSYTPRNRDIQFFFLNDNNKNWEYDNSEATGKIAYEYYKVVGNTPEKATFPQRSMEILNAKGEATYTELHSDVVVTDGYDSSKYMNYKVYWDNGDTTRTDYPKDGTFGTSSEPVLRFAEMNRKSYLTFEFPEADKIFYGQPVENTTDYTYNTMMRYLSYIDGFDNADKTSLSSREVNILMPDYAVYKSGVLSGITVGSPNSITNGADGKEAEDLYFKGWSFYTSYGYGPETVCPTNGRDTTTETKVINNIATRGMFNIDVNKINNDNVNAQLCPSFVAQWYTAEELAEARSRISGVKMQRVILKDNTEALRLIAVVGQQYREYDSAGFVISTTNATPTVEGGYNYSIKTAIYGKILTKNNSTGNESVYVSSSDIMSEDEFANGKGILYTNLKMTSEADKATVYYVTPYAYVEKTDTYYYGKSRAVSYNYAYDQDTKNGISPATE